MGRFGATQLEEELQRMTAEWVWLACRDLLAWHTPNGGKRSKATAGKMKAAGVLPGVGDWTFMQAGEIDTRVLFVELKTETGRQSEGQKAFAVRAEAARATYAVARSFEEFVAVVTAWRLG